MPRLLPALACAAFCVAAFASDYPTRAVTAVPAFPPGAPNDFIMRLVGEKFPAEFRQPLVVDNKPGAGGNVAAEAVSRAAPDGYTLLATVDTVVTANPSLYKTSFSADTDLAPVLYLANTAQTLVCHPAVRAKTVGELVALARSQRMAYASGGQGVPGHLAAELFIAAAGVQMTHVPYRGPGPAAQDVMAGVVPCGFLATPVVMPHVKAGKLQALAVTSARRSPIAPDVPTMAEAGIAGYEATFGEVLLVPRGTPAQVVRQLNHAIGRVLQQPDVRDRMLAVDLEYVPNTPEQAAARLKQERQRWKQVIERLGLRVEG